MKNVFTILMFALISGLFMQCSSSDDPIDSCEPITCLNGGVNISDCECDCPEGYTGTTCATQVAPLSITITNITVTSLPELDLNGNFWDTGIGNSVFPDLFVAIADNDGNVLSDSGFYVDDATNAGAPYSFNFSTSVFDFSEPFLVALFDSDFADTELMEVGAFFIYDPQGGFPDQLIVIENSMRVEIALDYFFL